LTPADLFERYWSRARRILVVALLVLGTILALALYLILA
jgi:phage shock protein PspC (stress-responsive transcriptional regulator)